MIEIRDGMKECASLGMNVAIDIIDEICLNCIECILNSLKCLFVRNQDIVLLLCRGTNGRKHMSEKQYMNDFTLTKKNGSPVRFPSTLAVIQKRF